MAASLTVTQVSEDLLLSYNSTSSIAASESQSYEGFISQLLGYTTSEFLSNLLLTLVLLLVSRGVTKVEFPAAASFVATSYDGGGSQYLRSSASAATSAGFEYEK